MLKDITLLFVDDDAYFRTYMSNELQGLCGRILTAANGAEALELFANNRIDLVLTDIYMPVLDGIGLTTQLREKSPSTPVVLYTAFTDVPLLIKGIELGVAGFVQKPPDMEQLVATLERAVIPVVQLREISELRDELNLSLDAIFGSADSLRALASQVARIARTGYSILLQGETGTGKSRLARIIHSMSKRAAGPFVAVQLGAIPETLITSELFGHEKGTFTGADRRREGVVRAAQGGTLFLDDIDAASPAVQALLLNLVEERRFFPLGAAKPVEVDIRIITASNRNLGLAGEGSAFRQDLFYRLSEQVITLPALRTVPGSIPALARQAVVEACQELGRNYLGLDKEAIVLLQGQEWPGNIRQLRNLLKRAAVMAEESITPDIIASLLGDQLLPGMAVSGQVSVLTIGTPPVDDLPLAMAEVEKWAIKRALEAAGGKKMVAARLLEMNYYTFSRHIARLGIDSSDS
jgi:DNA-binding NtrC family response regulator